RRRPGDGLRIPGGRTDPHRPGRRGGAGGRHALGELPMRNPSIAIAVLLAFACGGEDGPRGSAAAPCTATWDASGWTLRCPDGTEWTEAPRACDVVEEEGVRIVRCADGTEAVLAPPGVQGAGVVEGVVRLASHGPVAGAVVEV